MVVRLPLFRSSVLPFFRSSVLPFARPGRPAQPGRRRALAMPGRQSRRCVRLVRDTHGPSRPPSASRHSHRTGLGKALGRGGRFFSSLLTSRRPRAVGEKRAKLAIVHQSISALVLCPRKWLSRVARVAFIVVRAARRATMARLPRSSGAALLVLSSCRDVAASFNAHGHHRAVGSDTPRTPPRRRFLTGIELITQLITPRIFSCH